MNIQLNRLLFGAAIMMIVSGCDQSPTMTSTPIDENNTETILDTEPHINAQEKESANVTVHSVIVEEVLPTSSYVYLYVKEGEDKFWISTSKQEVKPGEAYLFHDAMLQTNFKSKELDRTFDTLYLVTQIVPVNSKNKSQSDMSSSSSGSGHMNTEGSVKIADLVNNMSAYSGKTIQLSGTCVKINKNIMGHHWIHLQDGSKDDYDLVITSDVDVPVGNTVTMKGVVTLDKDFGAGYQYDLIIERGEIVE